MDFVLSSSVLLSQYLPILQKAIVKMVWLIS